MGTNYHHVTPGAPVKFSASRENAITDMLNSMNGTSSGAMLAGAGSITRLKVFNPGTETLQAGWAVVFSDGEIIDGAVAANKFDRTKSIWGVLTDALDYMCFGEVIISGPVEVEISGGSGKFAAPASDGKTFTLGSTGAQVISHKDKKAVILLGGSGETIKLVKITSVPTAGYGAGTAKVIKGFNENGTPLLEETEIPVMIPRI